MTKPPLPLTFATGRLRRFDQLIAAGMDPDQAELQVIAEERWANEQRRDGGQPPPLPPGAKPPLVITRDAMKALRNGAANRGDHLLEKLANEALAGSSSAWDECSIHIVAKRDPAAAAELRKIVETRDAAAAAWFKAPI